MGRTFKGDRARRRAQWNSDSAENLDASKDTKSESAPSTEAATVTEETKVAGKETSLNKLWSTAKKKKLFSGSFPCFCTAANKNPELAIAVVTSEEPFFINDNGDIEMLSISGPPKADASPVQNANAVPATPGELAAKQGFKLCLPCTGFWVGAAAGLAVARYVNKKKKDYGWKAYVGGVLIFGAAGYGLGLGINKLKK